MKIGFFTDCYFPMMNGVSVAVEHFRRSLEELGHEVYVFCPQWPDQERAHESKKIVRFPSLPGFWYEGYRDTMPWTPANMQMLKQLNLDIVHVHTPAQIGLLGARLAKEQGIPLVTTYHTDIEQYAGTYRRLMLGFIIGSIIGPFVVGAPDQIKATLLALKPQSSIKKWNRTVIRKVLTAFHNECDLVIAPSSKIATLLAKYHTKTQVEVLPTGLEESEMEAKRDSSVFDRLGIDKQAKLLLFVGRLGKEKNIELAIKAMPEITTSHPDTKLLIVGDGPNRDKLERLTASLQLEELVIFSGMLNRPQALACFEHATLFVFPSLTDTQGLVLNEAAYFKTPLVYLDPDISPVTKDGETGVCSQNDAKVFASDINGLLSNSKKLERFGETAAKLAHELTMKRQATELARLYGKLLEA